MLDRRTILLPVFLLAQAIAVHWAGGAERPPAPPDLKSFPAAFGTWKQFQDDPMDPDVVTQLHADRLLSRTYRDPASGAFANLFVAWFQSQRGGASQPHSPKVCLPGAGWSPVATGEIPLSTASGRATINRYVVSDGRSRAVVLYWYQTPRRVIAGEWAAKLWLVADALRDKRTDTALVRVVVWSARAPDDAATATAVRFANGVYPLLLLQLPR
jgi:EpsI family protein